MQYWKTPKYSIVTTPQQLDVLYNEIENAINANTPVAIDVETTGALPDMGLDFYHSWLLSISICTSIHEGYYIPLNHTKDGGRVDSQLTVKEVVDKLKLIGDSKAELFMIDNELNQRVFIPPADQKQ